MEHGPRPEDAGRLPNTDDTAYLAELADGMLNQSKPLEGGSSQADKERRAAEVGYATDTAATELKYGDKISPAMRRTVGSFVDPEGDFERRESKRHAEIDPLTGLGNRLSFERARAAADADSNVTYGIIDVDHFGDVNETLLHPGGDGLAKAVGTILRETGLPRIFRYGGDEFVMLGSEEEVRLALKQAQVGFERWLTSDATTDDNNGHVFRATQYQGLGLALPGFVGNTFAEADAQLLEYKRNRETTA